MKRFRIGLFFPKSMTNEFKKFVIFAAKLGMKIENLMQKPCCILDTQLSAVGRKLEFQNRQKAIRPGFGDSYQK